MRVWIVEPVGYDEYGISGVYDSLEAAKASIHWCEWEQAPQRDGWYTVGASSLSSGYHAYEHEVTTLAAILEARRVAAEKKAGDRERMRAAVRAPLPYER